MKFILIMLSMFLMASCIKERLPHPSDLKMKENFEQNESKFIQLLNDFIESEKKEIREGDDPQFDHKMKDLEIYMIHNRGIKGEVIQFTVSSSGLATGGTSKSYVWRRKEPLAVDLVDDTDKHAKENIDFVVYRSLIPNWYIRREHDG